MSVSEKLRTYPYLKPKTVNWLQVRFDAGLGEGMVRSRSDTAIDPIGTEEGSGRFLEPLVNVLKCVSLRIPEQHYIL